MNLSQDFTEKIAFLLLTAALTGFLVPYILKKIDERKARQSKIIEAQSKFLDDITQMLWKWRYMSIRVVYYAAPNNREQYNVARKEYEENIWEVFNQIRREISISRRLVSEKAYRELLALYAFMVELDKQISFLPVTDQLNESMTKRAAELNEHIYSDVTSKIDEVIDYLASELHLKVKN